MVLNIISLKLTRTLLASFLILLLVSFNPSQNCKKYFPGKWKYDDLPTSTIYVVRTKKKQFEYTQNGKYYYEYDLKWLKKCKYQMTFVLTTDPNPAVAREGDVLIVEIIDISKSKMQYKTTAGGQQDIGKMTKID